jgi:protein-tyrosine phosphatase
VINKGVEQMLYRLRNTTPPLSLFGPCEDLAILSETISERGFAAWGPHSKQPVTELDKFVIKSRDGSVLVQNTILKEDFWFKSKGGDQLKGASNFRKVQGFPVYGVAQPTLHGLKNVLEFISTESTTSRVVWINLREEPFIYINGVPYVLRDTTITLRNIKSYQGITSSSLEFLETKLKNDVLHELHAYNSKILLHAESSSGAIVPLWEDCNEENVLSLKEAMEIVKKEMSSSEIYSSKTDLSTINQCLDLIYYRVPQTAESSAEAVDLDNLVMILSGVDLLNTAIVLNCQIGFGRSTSGTIITSLILRWLGVNDSLALNAKKSLESKSNKNFNYQVIHSLLRVIPNGIECKRVVDQVIDASAALLNIRDNIEEYRQQKESETNLELKKEHYDKGILALDRYFQLILFQSYLDQNPPGIISDLISFKTWKANHPEFDTIRDELLNSETDPLVPVDELEPGDGIALTNEVLDVVNRRHGAVLSQGTILKFDLFPGAQKMTLKERIDGAHNYRLIGIKDIFNCDLMAHESVISIESVVGVGMPTKNGIKEVLKHVGAGPGGNCTVYWTSLREEPVIYIKGRPYVLRLFIEPIKNLVTTGIARKRVEDMEVQMKKDIINEIKLYKSRLLLHEEKVEGNHFLVCSFWETVHLEDIETTFDIYTSLAQEGYKVDYLRIPMYFKINLVRMSYLQYQTCLTKWWIEC